MNRTIVKNVCFVAAFFLTAVFAVLMMSAETTAKASAASAEFSFKVREVEDPAVSFQQYARQL